MSELEREGAAQPSSFSAVPRSVWTAENALAFAILDRYPVTPGHTLVITKRIVPTWFDATADEQRAVLDLVEVVRRQLASSARPPNGFNVGFNVGVAAGQTVMHLHIHVIPRYTGDMEDPRGGVRHVIPEKGNYLRAERRPLATGGEEDPFLNHLRPLLGRARDVAIVAAFVQESGLEVLERSVADALDRGARIRLVTGDYLNITQSQALETLLDWSQMPRETPTPGALEARVIEVERLEGAVHSFHPKSWRVEGPGFAVAFVGSSNVSRAALATGIEWNLRVDRAVDPQAYDRVHEAFAGLWERARPLTREWVAAYAQRARLATAPLPPEEVEPDQNEPPPEPTDVQRDALVALERSRAEGRRRALVVLATGLGKTWLAAFDALQFERTLGRFPRVLFLAHRRELLVQARKTFRRLARARNVEARFGWFLAESDVLSGDVVLASVQKLSRPENLARLAAAGRFDYVVVDEVHHASSPSYREILSRLEPGFTLGLTATPERADEGDVLGIFDDHVAHRVDMGAGIAKDLLVPFQYFGLKDAIDYANIPWRNRRFDPAELAAAAQTAERMERFWKAWQQHPGTRTLVFCCSIEHARFAANWLKAKGVNVKTVHSEDDSDDRDEALELLGRGEIDAICAVDVFNEGVDVPRIDRVAMLRPTESPVVFLQQLGRGLRKAGGKTHLTVIDFVGNHRVFLEKIRALISFGARAASLRDFLDRPESAELPPGCSVNVELEAKDLLRRLLPEGNAVELVYRELASARGERPSAGELFRLGYDPGTLRPAHGTWFDFVASEGHLDEAGKRVLSATKSWLQEIETTRTSKCFKMVALEALIEAEALEKGVALDELARRSHAILARNPELFQDLDDVKELRDPRNPDPAVWASYWRKNPIDHWIGEASGGWFRVVQNKFVPRFAVAKGDETVLARMTSELVDYRLAKYRERARQKTTGEAFECKVLWNKREPILKLPDRAKNPRVPEGDRDVVAPDGRHWVFRFAAKFCNVARPVGAAQRNHLPDLLKSWFGETAGRPGTTDRVRFAPTPDGWRIEPSGARVLSTRTRRGLITFPTLAAAAGAATGASLEQFEASEVALPSEVHGEDFFAVRAAGDSMDGGARPIRDGDWLVLRRARGAGVGDLEGRVALVDTEDNEGARAYQVKRVVRDASGWLLRSDNPARASFAATERTRPVAVVAQVIRPEDLAPSAGARISEAELAATFGVSKPPSKSGRVDGHLFLCIEEPGAFTAPDRVAAWVHDRRPGETAFVLTCTAGEEAWRYGGVGRWLEEESAWELPALDYSTWRTLGDGGRESSRSLPEGVVERARAFVEKLLARHRPGTWLEHLGERCRLVAKAARGGLKVDGGVDGFAVRTISLVDLGWVLVARDEVRRLGGVLNEERVNQLRYLEGTPKGSTRWIDTGWAIVIVGAGEGN